MIPIRTALFSVTDKEGLVPFAKALREIDSSIVILASGGTGKALQQASIDFRPIEEYTGYPECFNGRVKTLHPAISGGILLRRGIDEAQANEMGILPIDLVVCNLYSFSTAAQDHALPMEKLIEHMDIGGSTLIRAACKNYRHVAVVVDPTDYSPLLQEMKNNKGKLSTATLERLAIKAMQLSARYESTIAAEFAQRLSGQEESHLHMTSGKKLRYGENPDQEAWVYRFQDNSGVAHAEVLGGKELSYNNYEDATVAYEAAQQLRNLGNIHGAAIVKHGSLCGYATASDQAHALTLAWEGDAKSAFGSVIALTAAADETLIPILQTKFVEVLIAPEFSSPFVEWAKTSKPNLRLLQAPDNADSPLSYKNISGGMLVQTKKTQLFPVSLDELVKPQVSGSGVVTKRQPEKQEMAKGFAFAIAAVNYAKSNTIAIVRQVENGFQLIGMGAGQPNRIDCLEKLALPKARENLEKEGCIDQIGSCILASDGFFPFDDSIRYAAAQGIRYCIQPGGSVKDKEVIAAADELEMCMIFTGRRYFTH